MAGIARVKQIIKNASPPFLLNSMAVAHRSIRESISYKQLRRNREFQDLYIGQRCFILGNAPSLKNHNLRNLAGEKVFSLSNGYLHPEYNMYKPQFHCLPQITFSNREGGMDAHKARQWLTEIFENTQQATLFLHQDIKKIKGLKSLACRDIAWIGTSGAARFDKKIDLRRFIASIDTAPQMAIAIALYMGFKEIYLLGIEYDALCSKTYEYFFPREKLLFKDPHVSDNNQVVVSRLDYLRSYVRAFEGFERLKKQAHHHECTIYNCSATSFLDMYSFQDFDSLFKNSDMEKCFR